MMMISVVKRVRLVEGFCIHTFSASLLLCSSRRVPFPNLPREPRRAISHGRHDSTRKAMKFLSIPSKVLLKRCDVRCHKTVVLFTRDDKLTHSFWLLPGGSQRFHPCAASGGDAPCVQFLHMYSSVLRGPKDAPPPSSSGLLACAVLILGAFNTGCPWCLGSLSGGPDLAFSSGTQNPSRACKRSQRLTTRSRSPVGQDCAHRRTCETRLAFLFLEARLRNLSSSLD